MRAKKQVNEIENQARLKNFNLNLVLTCTDVFLVEKSYTTMYVLEFNFILGVNFIFLGFAVW